MQGKSNVLMVCALAAAVGCSTANAESEQAPLSREKGRAASGILRRSTKTAATVIV